MLGLKPATGTFAADGELASFIEPDGPGTGGYLTYGNYRAILRYNCTNYYALSVSLLADAVGRDPVAASAPAAGPDGVRQ